MWDITVLIKSFKRPEATERLIESIKQYYPDLPYLVLDDSDEQSEYGFDIGVSRWRNILVSKCQTPYCMILDDDCIFTEKTDIKLALELIGDNDILCVQEISNGAKTSFLWRFDVDGDTVRYLPWEPYQFCNNIFIAKTDSLRKYPWDDKLKMGEHFAYFFKHRGNLKIWFTDKVEVRHEHVDVYDYRQYRNRSTEYVKQFMKDNWIKKRIDLFGNVLVI